MSGPYPAKSEYHGPTATLYDEQRFSSAKGKWLDQREKRSVARALEHLDPGSTILDLPCGTGRITQHLLMQGFRVAGGDISEEMIALAKRRIGNHDRLLGFHQLDAERMALPDDAYDCITSVRLMGHLPPTARLQILREMARVARKHLAITFYKAGPLRSLKWLLLHRARMSRANWYPVTRSDLRELFAACALEPIHCWHVCPVISDGITFLLRVSTA